MAALSGYIIICAGHAPAACLHEFFQLADSAGTKVHHSAAAVPRFIFQTHTYMHISPRGCAARP